MSAAELAALRAASEQAGDIPPVPTTREEVRRVPGWGLIQPDLKTSAECAR